jgi:hypothetical protein
MSDRVMGIERGWGRMTTPRLNTRLPVTLISIYADVNAVHSREYSSNSSG